MKEIWIPNGQNEVFKQKYVCLWADETGWIVKNDNREYLCAESWEKGDKIVEAKMAMAAKSLGIHGGGPIWQEGEKISQMEWEDQMERYLEGKIPDPKEEYRIKVEEAKNARRRTGITK